MVVVDAVGAVCSARGVGLVVGPLAIERVTMSCKEVEVLTVCTVIGAGMVVGILVKARVTISCTEVEV